MPAGAYDHEFPVTAPAGPDKLFYRGDFCGVRVPGVPILPGMSGYTVPPWNLNEPPSCPPIMALDVARYAEADRRRILAVHAARGYTHFQVSIGHLLEFGFDVPRVLEFCRLVREYVPFVDVWLLGGVWNRRDADISYWRPVLAPWIDALLEAGLIDTACVGWQLDQFNTGTPRMIEGRTQSPIQSIIDYVAERLVPHEIPIGTHWVNEAGAWNDPFDRFKWWKDQRGKLSFFHHQGDTDIGIPEYQAKLCDTLNPFGDGRMGTSGLFGDRPYGLVVFECSAQAAFDLRMSEADANQRGYLLCCTAAAVPVSGYGNGACRPDGMPL